MMTDLRTYLKTNACTATVKAKQSVEKLVAFLVANEWFGINPVVTGKAVYLTDSMIAALQPHIDLFRNTESKSENLLKMMSEKWPFTCKQLNKFLFHSLSLSLFKNVS